VPIKEVNGMELDVQQSVQYLEMFSNSPHNGTLRTNKEHENQTTQAPHCMRYVLYTSHESAFASVPISGQTEIGQSDSIHSDIFLPFIRSIARTIVHNRWRKKSPVLTLEMLKLFCD
jgi:hypothetical protein